MSREVRRKAAAVVAVLVVVAAGVWLVASQVAKSRRVNEAITRAAALESAGRLAAEKTRRVDAEAAFALGQRALEDAKRVLYAKGDAEYADILSLVEKARPIIQAGIAKAPEMAVGHYLLGRAWELSGHWDRAEEAWREAIKRDPAFAPAHFELGRLLIVKVFVATHEISRLKRQRNQAPARAMAEEAQRELALAKGLDDDVLRAVADAMAAFARNDVERVRELTATGRQMGSEELCWLDGCVRTGREAIERFDACLAIRPGYALAFFARGVAKELAKLGDPEEDYTSALRLNPRMQFAWINRAWARMQSGNRKGAADDCTKALELGELARAYAIRAFVTESTEDCSKALALDPNEGIALYVLANERANRGDLKGAMQDFDASLEAEPEYGRTWGMRGALRYQERDFRGAKGDFEMALKLDPRDGIAALYLGVIQLDGGDLPGAIEHLSVAVKLRPQVAEAHYQRGKAHFLIGSFRLAVADLTNALDLQPRAEALAIRGAARAMLGDADGGMGDCAEALRLDPRLVVAWVGRGLARLLKGNVDGAIEDCDEALKLSPREALAFQYRGAALGRRSEERAKRGDEDGARKDRAAAIDDCTLALKFNPALWDVYLTRAVVKSQQGDMEGAVQDVEEVLRRAPDDWPKRPAAERTRKQLKGQ